jgi:hypothetical protein
MANQKREFLAGDNSEEEPKPRTKDRARDEDPFLDADRLTRSFADTWEEATLTAFAPAEEGLEDWG